jgi:hypothetical protein
MDLTKLEQRWHVLNEHLAWAPLYPPDPPQNAPLYEWPFDVIILVRSKSDSPTGHAVHNHLLGVLRGDAESTKDLEIDRGELLDIPAEYRFTLVRTNAEIPANPVHNSFVGGVNEEAGIVAGFEYKQGQPAR